MITILFTGKLKYTRPVILDMIKEKNAELLNKGDSNVFNYHHTKISSLYDFGYIDYLVEGSNNRGVISSKSKLARAYNSLMSRHKVNIIGEEEFWQLFKYNTSKLFMPENVDLEI